MPTENAADHREQPHRSAASGLNPDREYRRFMLQFAVVLAAVAWFLTWRKVLPSNAAWITTAVLLVTSVAAVFRPMWFAGFHRRMMSGNAWLGERAGRVFLTVFFFVLMVPLGVVLRLVGHDALRLKRAANARTYWLPATPRRDFRRMY